MKKIGIYIITPIASFSGGLYVFIWAMKIFLNEEIGNYIGFLLMWGGMAFLIFAVPFYFVIIHLIDNKFNRFKFVLYPFFCMLLFFLPTSAIMGIWSSSSLFSPEAMLFYSFFLTSGLIFGLLNWTFKKISGNPEK